MYSYLYLILLMPLSLLSSNSHSFLSKLKISISNALVGTITITAATDSPNQASFSCSGSSTTTKIIATSGSNSSIGTGTAGSSILISLLTLTSISTSSPNTITFTAYNSTNIAGVPTIMYLAYNTSAGTYIPNRTTMYNYNLVYNIVGGGGYGTYFAGNEGGRKSGTFPGYSIGGGSGGYLLNQSYTILSQIQNLIFIAGISSGNSGLGTNSLLFFNNSLDSSFNGYTVGGGGYSEYNYNNRGSTGGSQYASNVYQIGAGDSHGNGAGTTNNGRGNTGGNDSNGEGISGGSSIAVSNGGSYGGGGGTISTGTYTGYAQAGSNGYSAIYSSKFISFTSNSTKSDIGFVSISSSGLILTFLLTGSGNGSSITMTDSTGASLGTTSTGSNSATTGTYTLSSMLSNGTVRLFYFNSTGSFNNTTNPYVSITFGSAVYTPIATSQSILSYWNCYNIQVGIIGGGEAGNPGGIGGSSGGIISYTYTTHNHSNVSFQNIAIGAGGHGIINGRPAAGGTTTMNICCGSSSNNSNIIAGFSSMGGGSVSENNPGACSYTIYETLNDSFDAPGNSGTSTAGGAGLSGAGTYGSGGNPSGSDGLAGGVVITIYYLIIQ